MGNVHMEATQINYREGNKKMSVAQAIKNAGSEITPEEKAWIDTIPELASQEIIAPEFDAEEGVYAVGDLVIYQGGLYKFTTAHETAGAWNPEEVAAVKVSDELSSLESGLTNLTDVVGWGVDGGNVLIPSAGGSKNGVSYTRVYDQLGYVTKYDLSNATTSADTAILPYRLPVKATSADYKVKYFNLPDGAGYMLWDDTTSSSISYGSGIITVPANHEVYIGIFIIDSGTDMSGKYLQVMATENTSDPMATYYPTRPVIGSAVADMESRIEAVESGLTNVSPMLSNVTISASGGISVFLDNLLTYIKSLSLQSNVYYTFAGIWENTASFVGYVGRRAGLYNVTVNVTDGLYFIYDNGTTVTKKQVTATVVN